MSDLTEFLLARIAEDERVARSAAGSPIYTGYADSAAAELVVLAENEGARSEAVAHARRHDPSRVLAECEAKRRIVAQERPAWNNDPTAHRVILWVLFTLALPYADHPDYREEWRP